MVPNSKLGEVVAKEAHVVPHRVPKVSPLKKDKEQVNILFLDSRSLQLLLIFTARRRLVGEEGQTLGLSNKVWATRSFMKINFSRHHVNKNKVH